VLFRSWSNASIYAFNNTAGINETYIYQNVQMANRAITITNTSGWTGWEGENVYVDHDATDPDSDSPTFSCNRTDLFAGSGSKVTERETPRGGIPGHTGSPYAGQAGSPYAYDPYGKEAVRDPYKGVPPLGETVSMNTTRRRNPLRRKKNKR